MNSRFSLLTLCVAGSAGFAQIANAYTKPVGDAPNGNPIYTPGLHQVVSACKPFKVTWEPTTQGDVDLVLLKGPSTNAVPQYAIVEKIPNSGSYVWTPASDLTPTGDQGYGLQLIDTATGQYQYSTQFGISNADCSSGPAGNTVTQISDGQIQAPTASVNATYAAPTAPSMTPHHANTTSFRTHSSVAQSTSASLVTSTQVVVPSVTSTGGVSTAASTSSARPSQGVAAGMAVNLVGMLVVAGFAAVGI